MTIRTRLTFLYSSLLAIVILTFSAATSTILNWTLRNQVDTTLLSAVDTMHNSVVRDIAAHNLNSGNGDSGAWMPQIEGLNKSGLYAQIWLVDQSHQMHVLHQYSLSLLNHTEPLDPEALIDTVEVRRDIVLDSEHARVVTVPVWVNGTIGGYIQVASSLRTVDAAIDRLLKIMLISGTVILLISLLAGDLLARRALRPIDTIAQAARQITAADDLSRRIPYDGPADEVGELTQVFNRTLERLERLFNVQRRFVADVSHEMRTPLTTIQGNLELMQRFGPDNEALEAMTSETRRMSRLVDDLLLLAKADAGRLAMNMDVLDLDTLVLEVYNQARMLSGASDVAIQLGAIDQAQVRGDADRIKQLLLNLVSNALKYTPDDGTITLALARQEHQAQVTVTDTGIGIPESDQAHIFDRFYRVDKARARMDGGTGLGLSIAMWIVKAHNGTLTVNSSVGEGSTFTAYLPLIDAASNTPPESTDDTLTRRPRVPSLSLRNRHHER